MATSIQERKLELIQWLSLVDDVSLLDKVSDLKEQSTRDWWDEISEAERESVSKGLQDAEVGRFRPHSDAKAIYERRS